MDAVWTGSIHLMHQLRSPHIYFRAPSLLASLARRQPAQPCKQAFRHLLPARIKHHVVPHMRLPKRWLDAEEGSGLRACMAVRCGW